MQAFHNSQKIKDDTITQLKQKSVAWSTAWSAAESAAIVNMTDKLLKLLSEE